MSIRICDRCGDITIDSESCTCATPYDPVEAQRRHRAAVTAARTTPHRSDHTVSTAQPPRPRNASGHRRRSTP